MMLRSARTLSRFSGLALIAAGTMAALSTGTFCYWRFGWIRLICPIGFVEASLSSGTIYRSLIGPFLVVLGLVVLLGRVFCSWLCPSNLVVTHIARLVKRGSSIGIMKRTVLFQARLASTLPVLDYRDGLALLVGSLVGIALFGYPFLSTFCPIGVITRNVISLFAHFRLGTDLFLLLLPVAAVYLFSWGCIAGCPLGSLQRFPARMSKVLRPVGETQKCVNCKACTEVCPVQLHPGAKYDPGTCTKCFLCVETCPKKAIVIQLGVK
jgi:ferredoxin-type protein NapH